ncbi:acyl-CoA thioesterase [Cupriavidus sp. TMH.W2]|uniref:acyl-CoA thioesterase n=1 Tax=Cupriavidus sp. TMH.W2 TaxID=3434465 RepID=UPI003D77089E
MTCTESVLSETPFAVRRRVKWGECDPAGVVYTPNFSEYVISAAELFYGHLFDGRPQQIKDEFGFGTPTRALELDFRRSLWPDDSFDIAVTVEAINTRTYTLVMTARMSEGGETAFVARLTPICVRRGTRDAITLPASLRNALEQYQRECEASQRSTVIFQG